MPALDLPLEQLKTYTGSSPVPKDFDTYWDNAVKEMHKMGTCFTTEPSEFKAPGVICEYLYFTGVGGAKVCGKFLRPEKINGKLPAVLMFHGYTGSSGGWVDKLAYAYAGFAVLALDVRGQMGRSQDTFSTCGTTLKGHIIRGLDSGDDPNNLFFRNVFLDSAQAARILMDMDFVDENRIGAMGGSQGGALTITCAALEPRGKMLAPTYPFLSDYRRGWEMDLFQGAYEELSYYLRNRDPRHQRLDAMFERLGYIDVSNFAPRVKGETYMFLSLMDNICPPTTQFAVYNKITAKKRCEIYPNHGHEGLPGQDELVFEFFQGL